MTKRFFACLLALLMLCTLATAAFADETAEEEPSTDNTLVIKNIETGENLPLKSGGSSLHQAGVAAKLMTVLLSYEILQDAKGNISVPMCASDVDLRGNSNYLGLSYSEDAQSLTLNDLLCAAAISTANDACVALAVAAMRYESGKTTDYYANYSAAVSASLMERAHLNSFVARMNERATELGCTKTHFTNCNGLADSASTTTAEDIALIAEALLLYPELTEIMDKPSFKLSTGGNEIKSKSAFKVSTDSISGYTNINHLDNMIVGSMGDGAFCAVASAEDNGLTYVFVVIADSEAVGRTYAEAQLSAYDTVKSFVPWALSSFKYMEVVSPLVADKTLSVKSGKNSDRVTVVASEVIELLITKDVDPDNDIEIIYSYDYDELTAPVDKGMKVGTVTVKFKGSEVASADLVTNTAVEASEMLSLLDRILAFLNSSPMKKVYLCGLVLLGGYFVLNLALFIYRIVRKYMAASKADK